MKIGNYSISQIKNGEHFNISDRPCVLIQILDNDEMEVIPFHFSKFKESYRFNFLDTNEESIYSITNSQAKDISEILINSKKLNYDIIVHCHAGICRSGAITESAKLIGYEVAHDSNKGIPNSLVYNKIRVALGFKYSWE